MRRQHSRVTDATKTNEATVEDDARSEVSILVFQKCVAQYTRHMGRVVCKVCIYIYIMCHMHINHICMIYLSLFIINILNHYHVRFLEWHQNGSTQSRRVPCKIVTWAFEAYKVLWCKRTSLRVAPQHQMTQRRSRRCTKCSLELEWMKACISVGLDARLCFFSRRMDMSNMFHATLHFFSCV